jgi:hypothetical protein
MPDETDLHPLTDRPSLLNRRGALRLLALSGASLMAGTGSSEAFWDFFSSFGSVSPSILTDLKIPSDWRAALGSQLPNYADYLRKARLRNVTVRQLIEPHTHFRGSVRNTLPPRAMWGNIRSTLKVIDTLSSRLDLPVKNVVSVYRCPAYNARCPGAKSHSYHLRNNAIDIVFPCPPGKVAAMARAMKSTGIFQGGVGRYGGFTHIDTRGTSVDW